MNNTDRDFYEFGPFRVDPNQRVLLRGNQRVPLQPKAFDTLLVLVRNSDKVVLKEDLMKSVWPDTFVEESNLTQNIFVLRKTLGESAGERRYIVTVPGRGYRFAAKVRTPEEASKEPPVAVPASPSDTPATRHGLWKAAFVAAAAALALAVIAYR